MNPYKMIIACANQKGGCAKTTTAVNVAAALARGDPSNGQPAAKVLLVDLDPQGNASTSFGLDKRRIHRTVYDLLMHDGSEALPLMDDFLVGPEILTDSMQEAWKNQNPDKKLPKNLVCENLWLLPSNIRLSGAEIELATKIGRETRLREALSAVSEQFDYIILDTPPSLGLLTINALAIANWLLIPVQAEYYALEGMSQLMNSIRLIQRRINPHLKLFGIAITMYDARSKLCNLVAEQVMSHFGDQVFQTVVPRLAKIAEAPLDGSPVVLLRPPKRSNKGSQAYWALSKEVHARVIWLREKHGVTEESILRREKLLGDDKATA